MAAATGGLGLSRSAGGERRTALRDCLGVMQLYVEGLDEAEVVVCGFCAGSGDGGAWGEGEGAGGVLAEVTDGGALFVSGLDCRGGDVGEEGVEGLGGAASENRT